MRIDQHLEFKRVGQSGQISIGKRYAGKALQVEHREDGSIMLTPVVAVPESQLWTLEKPHRDRIKRALEWSADTPPQESDLDALVTEAEKHAR